MLFLCKTFHLFINSYLIDFNCSCFLDILKIILTSLADFMYTEYLLELNHNNFSLNVGPHICSPYILQFVYSYSLIVIFVLKVDTIIPDGSSNNRSWVMSQFEDFADAKKKYFTIPDPLDPSHEISIIMDPSVSVVMKFSFAIRVGAVKWIGP